MSKVDHICDDNKCTGCMACMNSCEHYAISVYSDVEGFTRPKIEPAKCIGCKVCVKVCPVNAPVEPYDFEQAVYACKHRDEKIRSKSTSGGAFSAFAQVVLEMGGVVFGAAFDDEFKIKHIGVNCIGDLYKLRGSKYVQSEIGHTYKDIKTYLLAGQVVLFSGTPCQVAGLRTYLRNEPCNKLYTCDLICHGVPSPLVFEQYKQFQINRYNSNIKNISFRCKDKSWMWYSMRIDYMGRKRYVGTFYNDPFHVGFLGDYFSRDCCYEWFPRNNPHFQNYIHST